MVWQKVRCGACGRILMIRRDTLQQVLKEHQTLACIVPHCAGTMVSHGAPIIRRRTAELHPSYEFQVARQAVKRKYAPVIYSDDDDSDDEISGDAQKRPRNKAYASTDEDWAPPEQYSPAMRFTLGHMESGLRVRPPRKGAEKSSGRVQITAAVRGERGKSTSTAMGGIAAWKRAVKCGAPNAGRFSLSSRNHYEWCHLQAVCLGGYTLAGNLVAGHYALNTYMSVVEECLRGKTHIEVKIDVYCRSGDVADFILYSIFRSRDGKLLDTLPMDGRMTLFSKTDAQRLRDRLKKAVGK
ncbi:MULTISPECIES: hypothetical protein [Stenotrophomonas]|uniref:hypothetical protein n=1 Tax=Stenotrophomonas TaxID=40323 RepID=UPI000B6EF5C9|nr:MULTISPECIES: hypothetical protein [Stenotrophomonas]SMR76928.1 hypothetical protein SAMN04487863_2503 [Stenotrophomonas sp. yr243]SNS78995.1 hypothetical protein SAMN05518671_1971 [Stenotrophomonas lactitubi]